MFKNLGAFELLIIVAIVVLLFGGKKIPELMRGLGKGMHEFKKASEGAHSEDEPAVPPVNPPTQNKI
jgi:sec-independent protein translocase protein TatA